MHACPLALEPTRQNLAGSAGFGLS
jgi:hypothetical protein